MTENVATRDLRLHSDLWRDAILRQQTPNNAANRIGSFVIGEADIVNQVADQEITGCEVEQNASAPRAIGVHNRGRRAADARVSLAAAELEAAIGPRTAAVAFWIQPPLDDAIVPLARTVEIARANGVSAIADACSQIYPLEYMQENAQSADLVVFGAKYMGAPHSSGFVCGNKELIETVAAQSFVAFHYDGSHAVGRAMKVDRQEIVGVVTAVDDWFTMNHEDRILTYEQRFDNIVKRVRGIPGIRTERVEIPHYVPYMLHIIIDKNINSFSAEDIRAKMDAGNPRIWVGTKGDDTITAVVNTLNEGEDIVLAERLAEALSAE